MRKSIGHRRAQWTSLRRDAAPAEAQGSAKSHVRTCRLQFYGVGEKRTGYCVRVRKNRIAQTEVATPGSLRRRLAWRGLNAVDDTG